MIQKSENVLNQKNVKITKSAHAFKGFASFFNVEILYSFNHELQIKDTESATKELITELRGFTFVTTLMLVFKKVVSDNKTKCDSFHSN